VWQIDASVCVLYYMKSGVLKSMPKDEFYKNKPQNLARIVNDLCTRYVATDHASGTIWTRYFTGGETAQNLIDFFLWAVSQRQGMVAHGVPFMVMLDPGAANISHLFKNLCEQLQVKLQINEPGNPRAKGQVENAQNLVERHFEGLIRFMPTLDLEQLNAACERWQISFNAARKHTRHGEALNESA
jgi:transposase InsO family protein